MEAYTRSFVESASARRNIFHPLEETRRWLKALQKSPACRVERIPLAAMEQWHFEAGTGNLRHDSGRFFSIIGLDCRPAFGAPPWRQPIIEQPEVGILGIITKVFDGVRYFLMQAKMEPGNVNKVQISPTLQATFSNYTQAHKGRLPPYLDYFLGDDAVVIRDQLQSETGTRFLRKYNRNILLDVADEVELRPGFRWLTLYELQSLVSMDDTLNMDARSVLSNISYAGADPHGGNVFLRSAGAAPDSGSRSLADLRAWLDEMRVSFRIATERIALNDVDGWVRDEWSIRHASGNYFSVAGARVEAGEREVARWCQPLLMHEGLGLAGFLCADIGGMPHFLVQAKPEPGIEGSVELGPTVSVFDYHGRAAAGTPIPFLEYFLRPAAGDVLHGSIQSEEGGRFWNLRNRFLVVKARADAVPRHDRYAWMTLAQLQCFTQGESRVNSEARTLLSCLKLFP